MEDHRRRHHLEAGHRRPDQPLVGRRGRRFAPRTPTSSTSAPARPTSAATSSRATASTSRPTPARPGRTSASTETQVIAKIRVHPTNPDLVYVAAFGHHAGAESRARRLPIEGRRQDLGEDPLPRRQDRRQRAGARSEEPAGDLRRAVGGVPQRRRDVERRPGQRHLQVDRRRRSLDRDLAQSRACRRRCSARSAFSVSGADSQSRLRADRSGGRRLLLVRRRRRDLEEGERATAISASARSTTRASTPIRRSRTRSGC